MKKYGILAIQHGSRTHPNCPGAEFPFLSEIREGGSLNMPCRVRNSIVFALHVVCCLIHFFLHSEPINWPEAIRHPAMRKLCVLAPLEDTVRANFQARRLLCFSFNFFFLFLNLTENSLWVQCHSRPLENMILTMRQFSTNMLHYFTALA